MRHKFKMHAERKHSIMGLMQFCRYSSVSPGFVWCMYILYYIVFTYSVIICDFEVIWYFSFLFTGGSESAISDVSQHIITRYLYAFTNTNVCVCLCLFACCAVLWSHLTPFLHHQIQVPSLSPSSSSWSWDREEDRRRQEKWQEEQERLLQVKTFFFFSFFQT